MVRDAYVLGHAEAELRRLGTQARLIDPITRRFLRRAGISEGMRVLDVGCGAGHTALLLAELVGSTGAVVGVDVAPAAVVAATRRAAEAGLDNVHFRLGDPAGLDFPDRLDAVTGRYVLMFQPDPVALLRQLVRHLGPGGIVAFHEPDWDGARCMPPVPAYDRICSLVRKALGAGGADPCFGTRLGAVFAAAGLPAPNLTLEAAIGTGPQAVDVVHLTTNLAVTLQPAMLREGIIEESEPGFAEQAAGILSALGPDGTAVGRSEIGAWTTI